MNAKQSDSAIGYAAASHFLPRGKSLTDSRLAALCADAAWLAFLSYRADFQIITGRAADRFLRCDWPGAYADAAERLGLYGRVLDELVATIHRLMGERLEEKPLWAASKAVYSSLITRCDDAEIAESFFNSLTRRVFATADRYWIVWLDGDTLGWQHHHEDPAPLRRRLPARIAQAACRRRRCVAGGGRSGAGIDRGHRAGRRRGGEWSSRYRAQRLAPADRRHRRCRRTYRLDSRAPILGQRDPCPPIIGI